MTRVVTLDPTKNEMTWLEMDKPNAPDALRRTQGLDEFARKGYGVFEANFKYRFGNHHLVTRCHYILDPNMFTYVWYQSEDGEPFVQHSVKQLTRDSNAMAVSQAPKLLIVGTRPYRQHALGLPENHPCPIAEADMASCT